MKDIKQLIREIIRKKGPIRKVAQEIGIDHANLIRMLRENSDPRLKTIERIIEHLGYSLTLKREELKNGKKAVQVKAAKSKPQ